MVEVVQRLVGILHIFLAVTCACNLRCQAIGRNHVHNTEVTTFTSFPFLRGNLPHLLVGDQRADSPMDIILRVLTELDQFFFACQKCNHSELDLAVVRVPHIVLRTVLCPSIRKATGA